MHLSLVIANLCFLVSSWIAGTIEGEENNTKKEELISSDLTLLEIANRPYGNSSKKDWSYELLLIKKKLTRAIISRKEVFYQGTKNRAQ